MIRMVVPQLGRGEQSCIGMRETILEATFDNGVSYMVSPLFPEVPIFVFLEMVGAVRQLLSSSKSISILLNGTNVLHDPAEQLSLFA